MQVIKRRHGARNGWRPLLGFVAVFALLSLPAAAAWVDPDTNSIFVHSQSLRSETTFDGFEDNYDWALMPAMMAFFQDDGGWWVQSGNTGGIDSFQIMHYRPLGPGYGSARLSYTSNEFELDAANFFESFDEDTMDDTFVAVPDTFDNVANASGESEAIDLTLAYGWQLGGGPVNQSIGIILDYFTSSTEFDGRTSTVSHDTNAGSSDIDYTETATASSNTEHDVITLGVEWMRKNNNGVNFWLRGFLQDIDHTVEDSIQVDSALALTPGPAPGPPGGGACSTDTCSIETSSTINTGYRTAVTSDLIGDATDFLVKSRGFYGGGPYFFIPYQDEDGMLGDVSRDGTGFGAQARVEWGTTGGPMPKFRAEAGFSSNETDTKPSIVWSETFMRRFETDDAGPALRIEEEDDSFTQPLLADDHSDDSFFVAFNRYWNAGDLNVVGGVRFFSNESTLDITVGHNDDDSFVRTDDGVVTFRSSSENREFARFASESTWESLSAYTAATYQVHPRVELASGAQFTQFTWEQMYHSNYTGGTFNSTSEFPPAAPTTFTDLDMFDDTFLWTEEETESRVDINVGARFNLGDNLDASIMFAGGNWDEQGSNRNAIDFNHLFLSLMYKQ